jgi:hypothetical protein
MRVLSKRDNAGINLMMDENAKLAPLTKRLKDSPILSHEDADKLRRAALSANMDKILSGQTYGEATGGLAILNQDEATFKAELKSIDNDLGRQVEIVNEALDNWYEKGQVPPPYYAWRIAVILSKTKKKEEEKAFLEGWCKHFGDSKGGRRYEALAARAKKMGVSWEPQPQPVFVPSYERETPRVEVPYYKPSGAESKKPSNKWLGYALIIGAIIVAIWNWIFAAILAAAGIFVLRKN